MDIKDYFAQMPADKIAAEILTRVEDYQEYLMTSGRLALWKRSYEYYYNPAIKGSRLNRVGAQAEFTSIKVNHYRNLLVHLETMTMQQRPAFDPKATNTDYKSQAQTILANGLLEYYMKEKKLERNIKLSLKHSLIFGEGFVLSEWDATSGEVYEVNPETQAPIRQGDLRYMNFMPMDVARDFTKQSSEYHDWYIVTSYKNRYTLAAKYPELAEKILALPSKTDTDNKTTSLWFMADETDDVPVYTLYHNKTDAVADGRVCECLSSDIVLLDGPLPYRNIPVFRIAPEEMVGTPFGYTVGFDLLPVQEAIDALYSTVITNQSTFGVQNIAIPQGHNLSVTAISGGLNLIEYDSKLGKPEALNLTSTPPEIFNFITQLEQLSETLSGVNSVARGNPESSLKSGSALALVQSMAIQFSISLQQSYAQLLEDLGTSTINILRDFASVPRIAVIAGKSNRSIMKQFTGDDLDLINRVTVDMGNPLSKTSAGRVQLAENLMANGLIENGQQYIQVLSTGKLEPAIEGIQAELLNIKAENEEMSEGKNVPVIVTDNHKTHILEHKAILASPDARRNPQIIQLVTAHIQEHLNVLMDPMYGPLLGVLGQQTMQAPMGGPPQPGAAQPAPGGQMLDATNPATQQAAKVNQPNMPTNPMDGQGQ